MVVGQQRGIAVPAGRVNLIGDLTVPDRARGLVLFAHGSGSSRLSPRNRSVAQALNDAGFATLLVDLLTAGEERIDDVTRALRFDIGLLAERLVAVTSWLARAPATARLRIGYFGASTGAAAALVAASRLPNLVGAVVSRGGRPDLARAALDGVRAPTLLIVGSRDTHVIDLNREAFDRLRAEKELVLVRGATHLFEEPGALESVAQLAQAWFERHVGHAAVLRSLNAP